MGLVDKVKRMTTKKILTYAFMFALFAFVFVLTWLPIIFDLEHLDIQKYLTNSLINVGIMISAIILGELFGEDRQKENVDGLYQIALARYNKALANLRSSGLYIYFAQFFIWEKAKELKEEKEGYLVDNNIDPLFAHYLVEYAEKEDIDKMLNSCVSKKDSNTGKEIKLKQIDSDEYEIIKVIFSPDFNLDTYEHTYYLSSFGDGESSSKLRRGKKLNKKLSHNKTFRRLFKISLSMFISFLFGMATISELSGNGMKEAVSNTITRMTALFGGLLSGFLTSVISVKILSEILDDKSDILETAMESYEKREFIPKTYEEIVDEK